MKVFMFAGQGSQIRGMGKELFRDYERIVTKADKILGYSVEELCVHDPGMLLNNTEFTQPALFVVNALAYLRRLDEIDEKPDYLIGNSLGELSALFAAKAFTFESGVRLVKKRGELMGKAVGGGMAAVINSSEEGVRSILNQNGFHSIEISSINTPTQIVLSGPKADMKRARMFFNQGRVKCYPLKTSGAFHSSLMAGARDEFEKYLKRFKFSNLETPVIANISAMPYLSDNIVHNLSSQLVSPVNWLGSINYLMQYNGITFEEIGHSQVLSKMIESIRKAEVLPVKKLAEPSSNEDGAVYAMSRRTRTQPKGFDADVVEEGKIERSRPISDAQSELLSPCDLVKKWNKSYRIGDKVRARIVASVILETRTEAILLFKNKAVVYLKGYSGYFEIQELSVVADSD